MDVKASTPEPPPQPSQHPAAGTLLIDYLRMYAHPRYGSQIIDDTLSRMNFGLKKYGTLLHPFNGRDTMNDVYQEILDGLVYARSLLYEVQNDITLDPTRARFMYLMVSSLLSCLMEAAHYAQRAMHAEEEIRGGMSTDPDLRRELERHT